MYKHLCVWERKRDPFFDFGCRRRAWIFAVIQRRRRRMTGVCLRNENVSVSFVQIDNDLSDVYIINENQSADLKV